MKKTISGQTAMMDEGDDLIRQPEFYCGTYEYLKSIGIEEI